MVIQIADSAEEQLVLKESVENVSRAKGELNKIDQDIISYHVSKQV